MSKIKTWAKAVREAIKNELNRPSREAALRDVQYKRLMETPVAEIDTTDHSIEFPHPGDEDDFDDYEDDDDDDFDDDDDYDDFDDDEDFDDEYDTVEVPALYGAVDYDEWGRPKTGDWIQTFTGKKFHPLDIHPEDIEIDDIAHALSLVNRFTGHTTKAYSVAEHSVRCMWAVLDLISEIIKVQSIEFFPITHAETLKLAFEALMHDASETYVADLARPIKMMPQMASYRELEEGVEKAIRSKYGLPVKMSPVVKRADVIMLMTEKRDLMGPSPAPWTSTEQPLPAIIKPWSADLAEYRFKEEYFNLLEKLGIEG